MKLLLSVFCLSLVLSSVSFAEEVSEVDCPAKAESNSRNNPKEKLDTKKEIRREKTSGTAQ